MGLNHQPSARNGPATPARATTSTRKEPHAHRMGLNHRRHSHKGPPRRQGHPAAQGGDICARNGREQEGLRFQDLVSVSGTESRQAPTAPLMGMAGAVKARRVRS